MALQKQKFNISFVGGVDTKTDDKQVIPGKLLSLENGILTKLGKVIKRNGYKQLGGNLTSGNSVTTFQRELLVYDGTTAYSYAESLDSMTNKGNLNVIGMSSEPVIRNTYQQTNADSISHPNGLEVYTWDDSRGGSRYSCVDSGTGQIIVSDQLISLTASKAKPIVLGQYVVIFHYDSSTQRVRALPIPVLTPQNPLSIFDVAIPSTTNPNYDACLIGERAFVAFNTTTSSIGIFYINAFLQSSTTQFITSENANGCISIVGDTTNDAIVAYYDGTNVKYLIRAYDLSAVLAPTTIETIANIKNITSVFDNGAGTVFYTQTAAANYNNLIRKANITMAGAVSGVGVFVRSVSLCTKAFFYKSIAYVGTVYDTALQPTIFLINGSGVVVAKVAHLLAGGTVNNNMLGNISSNDGLNYHFAFTKKDLLDSVSGTIYTQTGISDATITFNSDNSFQHAELANNLHVTGGLIQMYDGVGFVEHNFNYYPENFTVAETGSGGLEAGSRQYVVTYEWLDNMGQIHRSTTSVPVTFVSTGNNKQNTLTIPTLRLTEKKGVRSPVEIVIYRTTVNGSIFYQVSSTANPTYNNTATDSVTYVDTTSDVTLIGRPLLYTTGGVMDNTQAEATNLITNVRGRIFYVPSENRYSYNYSKQTSSNLPVEFYDQQAYEMDRRGGPITAIAPLDDKVIFFKERAIFYIIGEGPDSTGSQNDYAEPQLITTDGGCIDPSSVVAMPLGLMYKSAKGIYLLNRGLNVEYIGKDVEAYNGDTIYSAILMASKNQVRFALNTGVVLVYDYLVGQWYTFTNHNKLFDATVWQDKYVYIRTDGKVWMETDGYSDNGSPIVMKIVTSWFSLAQFEGFQRIYKAMIIGNYMSKHKLVMSVAYDFNPYNVSSVIVDAFSLMNTPNYGDSSPYGSELVYGGKYPLYQFKYQVPKQKCQSIQFTFYDSQTDSDGEGYQLSGLAVEVGVKQGLNKLGASRNFS